MMSEKNGLHSPLRFPYVLFDLGGTLIYFDGDWPTVEAAGIRELTQSLQSQGYALDGQTFPYAYFALIQQYYQKGEDTLVQYPSEWVLRQAVAQALPAHSPQPPAGHLRQALKRMYAVSQKYWHVEPDAAAALQALREMGCRLGIISNAPDDDDVQTLVDNARLRAFFDFVLTSAKAKIRKPDSRIFIEALALLGARPDQAVMIGDTIAADVAGAKRVGIASVWIPRRKDTPENRAAAVEHCPDATINALSEVPALLRNWPSG